MTSMRYWTASFMKSMQILHSVAEPPSLDLKSLASFSLVRLQTVRISVGATRKGRCTP